MPTRKRRVRQAAIVRVFADRLREVRISRGMTQAELAQHAQITTSYIWRLESGASAPGIDSVDRLAKALGTTSADLLAADEHPETLSILKHQARKLFDSFLHSADRDALLMLNPLLARLRRSR